MSKIDENKTWISLSLVASLFSVGIMFTGTMAFWIKGVNDRLTRIEDKLGIPHDEAIGLSFFSDAHARPKK